MHTVSFQGGLPALRGVPVLDPGRPISRSPIQCTEEQPIEQGDQDLVMPEEREPLPSCAHGSLHDVHPGAIPFDHVEIRCYQVFETMSEVRRYRERLEEYLGEDGRGTDVEPSPTGFEFGDET